VAARRRSSPPRLSTTCTPSIHFSTCAPASLYNSGCGRTKYFGNSTIRKPPCLRRPRAASVSATCSTSVLTPSCTQLQTMRVCRELLAPRGWPGRGVLPRRLEADGARAHAEGATHPVAPVAMLRSQLHSIPSTHPRASGAHRRSVGLSWIITRASAPQIRSSIRSAAPCCTHEAPTTISFTTAPRPSEVAGGAGALAGAASCRAHGRAASRRSAAHLETSASGSRPFAPGAASVQTPSRKRVEREPDQWACVGRAGGWAGGHLGLGAPPRRRARKGLSERRPNPARDEAQNRSQ
jgi:hypothetical protein